MAWFKKTKVVNAIEYSKENQQADNYLGAILNAASNLFNRGGGTIGISPDGKRNYNELFGYGVDLCYADYKDMFKRGGIANTVVAKLPKSCWRDCPKIKLNDDVILENELLKLNKVDFFGAIERADIANRIGMYSVLFIGVPDGLDPSLPIGMANKDNFSGMYFNAYEEDGVIVSKWDTDPASPRYNQPEIYTLQASINSNSKLQPSISSIQVHHSRIVHIAEGALSNKLEGCSSLEAPWNAITDKLKVSGSNGEANFKNSRQKIVLSAREGAKFDPNDVASLKENAENFQNNQEDFLRTKNMDTMAIQPNISSPRDAYDINVEEVAGTTGIPVRILTTKAGGSVTGSEDKATWNALVLDRQDHICTPILLSALQIMANVGILELPEDAKVVWPKQSALSEKESSETMKNKADAFKSAAEGLSTIGADEVIAKSVFESIGLEGIEIDDLDLEDKDKEINDKIGG